MGKYINQTTNGAVGTSSSAKCNAILADGGIEIPAPTKFQPNLVCVVDNGHFAAAGYCYNEREFDDFNYSGDHRPKRWFVWDKVEQFAQ
ncbi:MAG TPA: hypothetical protein PKL96_12785 [Bacteroidales bacterium]|nr:hypothetical protein [Bacteroidales bacterium]